MKIKGTKNKLVVEGSLIFDNAAAFKDVLLNKLERISANKPVVLDLSRVEEIDSSGLQLLISFFKTLEKRDIHYKVDHIRNEMLEILELTGLTKFFNLEVKG